MKATTGFMELVIVMVFMIAAVPLIITLVATCNSSHVTYLDDKTMYDMSGAIEYERDADGRMIPKDMLTIHTDAAGAFLIAVVNDDYCPKEACEVVYDLGYNNYDLSDTTSYGVYRNTAVTSSNILRMERGYKAVRNSKFGAICNNAVTRVGGSNPTVRKAFNNNADRDYYLIYNTKLDCWVVTMNPVNIFD